MKVLPRRRRAVLLNSLLGVVLLAGGGLAYTTVNADATTSARSGQTRTATVAKGTVLATVSGSGSLTSPTDAGVDFVTRGTLTAVEVEVGDTVRKGQVLAKVSTADAQAKVDTAQAALDTAQAALTKAEAGETVTTTVSGSGSGAGSGSTGGRSGSGQAVGQTTPQPATTTTTTVDASAVAQARQQVAEAENTLSDAEAALAGTVLKAPVGGTVASVGGKVGDTVSGTGTSSSSGSSGSSGSGSGQGGSAGSSSSSSTPSGFVVITNPAGMQVDASFSESDALKVKKGQAATVTLNAQPDTELNAKVLSISSLPSSSSSSGSGSAVQYAARLRITSGTSKLRTGMSATISVVTGEADNALYVPTNALSGTGSSRTATVVKDDGSTERRTV